MAVKIEPSDLNDQKYQYQWTARENGDNPKVKGHPDSDELNRKQGYEILVFINSFMDMCGFKRKVDAQKAECLIQEYLPSKVRSRANVREWLRKNWHNPRKIRTA